MRSGPKKCIIKVIFKDYFNCIMSEENCLLTRRIENLVYQILFQHLLCDSYKQKVNVNTFHAGQFVFQN